MMLDFAAVRLNPERAAGKQLMLNIVLSDSNEKHLITIENGVLIHEAGVSDDKADATVTMKRAGHAGDAARGRAGRAEDDDGRDQGRGQSRAPTASSSG